MRVLVVLQDPHGSGGTERTALLEAEGLARRGHEVHVLHAGGARPVSAAFTHDLDEPALFDYRVRPTTPDRLRASARVRRHVDTWGIDLLHLHSVPNVSARRHLAAGRPVVVTAHNVACPNGARYQWARGRPCEREVGLSCLTTGYRSLGCGHLGSGEPVSLPGFGYQMLADAAVRHELRTADGVLAPSTWMAGHLRSEGVDGSRVRVVEPPVVSGADDGSPLSDDSHGPWDPHVPLVSFVGRLVAIKGADVLLRACAQVTSQHRLVIAGDGGARSDLESLARDLGITARTEFVGQVTPSQAAQLRRRSAVVAVPSVVPETFGMVGPEALAVGVPVVAHDLAGMADWIAAGGPMVAGVPLRDVRAFAAAIDGFLQVPPTATARREVAEVVRSRYSVDRHVDAVLEAYADLGGQRPGDGPVRARRSSRAWTALAVGTSPAGRRTPSAPAPTGRTPSRRTT